MNARFVSFISRHRWRIVLCAALLLVLAAGSVLVILDLNSQAEMKRRDAKALAWKRAEVERCQRVLGSAHPDTIESRDDSIG